MNEATHLAASADVPSWVTVLAAVAALIGLGLLLFELRRRAGSRLGVAVTGMLAVVALVVAVVRPVRVAERATRVGPRVWLLVDRSRSMALAGDDGKPRDDRARAIVDAFAKGHPEARVASYAFGDGPPSAYAPEGPATMPRSDLATALRTLGTTAEERPQAVVVVSDGRLDDPPPGAPEAALKELAAPLGAPVHTIAAAARELPDASVRRVSAIGAAVAHVPLPLRVEVGCSGGLACDRLTVTARELKGDGPPALLASGVTEIKDGHGTVDLTVTFDRAGTRILEVAIASPDGDVVKDNDRRLLTFRVTRDRIRVLHVAGRPTNDVRALRHWLKSDASVDVVAFFILRTASDNPLASAEDLALIPFPVDELFSKHLASFDAVVLQDFDAQPYGLMQYLPTIARYVRGGGGLVMVGGPNSFVAGGYAGTELAEILPVDMDRTAGATGADLGNVTPRWTEEGEKAPMLAPLRALTGQELPQMPGTNVVGDLRRDATALWVHPTRVTPRGVAMPLLATYEPGNGRTLALTIDGAWLLEFSELGARTGGRGYGAFWNGLLGWLMHDPRYEPAQLELAKPCLADVPSPLRVRDRIGLSKLVVRRLDAEEPPRSIDVGRADGGTLELLLPKLPAGAYAIEATSHTGATTRLDVACEAGGDEWADSRPDPDLLAALAKVTKGRALGPEDAASVPLPDPAVVSSERRVVPLAPAWLTSLAGALLLGLHWLLRRRVGHV